MARKTNRQKFIDFQLKEVEENPDFLPLKTALYKELILAFTQGKKRRLYDQYIDLTSFYYQYSIEVKHLNNTPFEELGKTLNWTNQEILKPIIEDINLINVL